MLRNEDGISIVLVFGILVVLGLLAFALVNRTMGERQVTTYLVRREVAFNAAEGGLERALLELKQDFVNDTTGSPSWGDSVIGTIVVGPDSNYYTLYDTTSLGDGSYFVELKNVPDGLGGFLADEICVRSTGITDRGGKRVIEDSLKIENLSPWDDAISAGTGQAGKAIDGNVKICGSVHVLGEGLTASDNAIEMVGDAGIRNYYEGIDPELSSRIPPLPITVFNGEEVQTLEATLRVKHGRVDLSGTATVGELDSYGNTFKETMDGVYVTDGYEGFGADNVYSDNGTENPYDLEDAVQFPSLSDPYTDPETGTEYDTYLDYLSAEALHITKDEISSDIGSFSYSDAENSISWDGDSLLCINGIIYINSDLDIGKKDKTVKYDGKGTLVSTGDISIHGDLLSEGTFPTQDALGLIAVNNMNLATGSGESQLKMIGAFYADSSVISAKQNQIAGTFLSNYFEVTQVPRIYQVPALATNLPPGLPGGEPVWVVKVLTWREILD